MKSSSVKKIGLITLTAALLITLIKWLLAHRLELYSDEIFYWQASRFPALAYSDLPFMTALLAGSGNALLGDTPFAVRSMFLLLGLLIPPLIYWLALPLQGQRRALQSTALSFCLPMLAMMGLLAVPDVALIVFGLLFTGFLERATRLQYGPYWLATGVSAALGLCTHYRFAPYILAALLFLLISRKQWQHWRSPWLWAGGLIAALGLYPALSFNLGNQLSGLDYHLVDRHPWQFQAEGLLHILMQIAVVTPLLYAALLFTLWKLIKQARTGDDRALLFALFAICNAGIYMVLAPWADTTRTTLHWPISGYLPLLVFAPRILSDLTQQLTQRYSAPTARRLVLAVPVTGFIGTLLLFTGIGSQGFNQALQGIVGQGVLSNKMAGWAPLTSHTEALLRQYDPDGNMLVVTDNYYTAAQIGFASGSSRVYTTDTNKIIRDGRETQYRIWGRDIEGLRRHQGADAIFITEDSTLDVLEKTAVMQTACNLFTATALIDQLFIYEGEKIFSFYRGQRIRPDTGSLSSSGCPLPSMSWIDSPARNASVSGLINVSGWAFNNNAIAHIDILLNGRPVARTTRSIGRQDVVDLQQDADKDPDAPVLGFSATVDATDMPDGRYQLSLEIVSGNGERQRTGARTIYITKP